MTNRQVETYWRTIAVQPAPPGWRVLSIFAKRRDVEPIAAWLLQERHYYYIDENETEVSVRPGGLEANAGPDTRVIPGICAGGWGWEVRAIDVEGTAETWKVLGPGAAEPTDEEWEAEITRRRASSTATP